MAVSELGFYGNKDGFFPRYGSFWRDLLEDRAVVRDFAQAVSLLLAQLEVTQAEREALVSFSTAPNYRRRILYPLTFKLSEADSSVNVVEYGSGRNYGDGLLYGSRRTDALALSVPKAFKGAKLIVNNLVNPTKVFRSVADFVVEDGRIVFRENIFDDPTFEKRTVFSGGVQSDEEIVVWCIDAEIHDASAYLRHGAILGLLDQMESNYAESMARGYDVWLQGGTQGRLFRALSASAGLRVAEEGETVIALDSASQDALLVITDSSVYRFHKDATPLVSVGDVLADSQELVDTIQIVPLNARGVDLAGVPALAIDRSLGDVERPLGFSNQEEPISLVDGGVRWPLTGYEPDVEAFWRAVRAREAASGQTLEQALRAANHGHLPATINPMRFVIDEVFGGNAVLILTKPQHFLVSNDMPSKISQVVRRFMSPRVLLLQYVFLQPVVDCFTWNNPDEVAFYDGQTTVDVTSSGLDDTLIPRLSNQARSV